MKTRQNIYSNVPKAYEVLIEMEKFISKIDLDKKLKELMKIRASQINKCAYCLEMHIEDALKIGEEAKRIYALSAWHESPYFSDEERAVLELTEQVTEISKNGLSDEVYENLKNYFSEKQIAEMIILLGQINFWNRINVASKQIYKSNEVK